MEPTSVEEAVKELRSLSREKPLKDAQLKRFKELCIFLRAHGFTNAEISRLTDGAYSAVTIKEYTRGTKVKYPDSEERLLGILLQMVDSDLDLQSVSHFVELDQALQKKGLSVRGVADFVGGLPAGKDIKDIFALDAQLKALKLSPQKAQELVQYVSQMKQLGMDSEHHLKAIRDVATKYGSFDAVISAINSYGGLSAVQEKISKANDELKAVMDEAEKKKQDVLKFEEKIGRLQKDIDAVVQVRALGLDSTHLSKIKEISTNLGGGPREFLDALKEYSSLVEIQRAKATLQKEREELETKTEKLNVGHAHLQTVINMCNKLLFEHHFTIEAIQDVYRLAEKFGEPISVLRAIEAHGSMQNIQSKISEKRKHEADADARIAEKLERISELDRNYKVLEESYLRLKNSIISKLEQESSAAMEKLAVAYRNSIDEIAKQNSRFAEIEGRAQSVKDELDMARFIVTARSFPDLAKQLPAVTAIQFIDALERLLIAKGINPQIALGKIIADKFPSSPTLHDVVAGIKRYLESYIAENAVGA